MMQTADAETVEVAKLQGHFLQGYVIVAVR